MNASLKSDLVAEMKRVGAFDVKVANPHVGFEHAEPDQLPLAIMPEARSVVVFALPRGRPQDKFYFGFPRSEALEPDIWTVNLDVPDPENYFAFRLGFAFTSFVLLRAATFLMRRGFKFEDRHYLPQVRPLLHDKLCAYEAGLGVYGKSGIIIHPILGGRLLLGTFLTDAEMPPDPKLNDFNPCDGCNLCISTCPAHAFGETGEYHASWSREKCEKGRESLRGKGYQGCSACMEICPTCKVPTEKMFVLTVKGKKTLEEFDTALSSAGEYTLPEYRET